MVKLNYIIHSDKLFRIYNEEEFECTKEELTKIILEQDKNRAELSDKYLEKISKTMKEAASVDIDYRYEIAKTALSSLIQNTSLSEKTSSKDCNGNYTDVIIREKIQAIIEQSFTIADKFIKQGKFDERKNN